MHALILVGSGGSEVQEFKGFWFIGFRRFKRFTH
jgi:hypothetical protein